MGKAIAPQYSRLENPMDGGACWAVVLGVAKCRTRLSFFPFTFHFHALEKEMAAHSSVLAWRIPGTGEPGGLLSMGSHRVGHDWSDLAAAAAAARERGFPDGSIVKNPSTNAGDVGYLGREDPLEKEITHHSSILTEEVPWTEKTGSQQSMHHQRVGYNSATKQ